MLKYDDLLLSNKDRIKGITLPKELSSDLAYLCGILAGDGHIETNFRGRYEIYCTGNPADEQELYRKVLLPLLKNLFNIDVKARHFPKTGTFGFRFGSKAVVCFLTKILGLPHGRKYAKLKIPS